MVRALTKRWWWIGAVGVLAVAAIGVLTDHSAGSESAPVAHKTERATTVTVLPVTIRSMARRVPVVGTLYGKEEIEVRPEVDGPVLRYFHDVGATVKPGDVLFEIDPERIRLAVQEAERAVEWERANLGLLRVPAEAVDVNQLPAVVDATLNRDQGKRHYERSQQLWTQRTITKEEWEKSETDYKRAEAALQKAIDAAQASLASMRQKQAKLASEQKKLKDTRVVVPQQPSLQFTNTQVEYLVAERNVTEGEIIGPNMTGPAAYRLVIANPLKLEAAVGERYAGEVALNQKAGILTEATQNNIYIGTVSRVHPAVDRVSRTFRVEIELPNDKGELHPGSFGKGLIETHVDDAALTVPADAIVRFAGVIKVFVVRANKAVAVQVKLLERTEVPEGKTTRVWFEVKGDLKAGENVCTSGQSQLSDGAPVVIRQPQLVAEIKK